jgi:hypothetical protein
MKCFCLKRNQIRDYAANKLMGQNGQGGQSSARRTRGFATDSAHGVTRPYPESLLIDPHYLFNPPKRRAAKLARRFCFCNFAAAGKVPAWESRCGNSSK